MQKEKNIYKKYLILFIAMSFGILWFLVGLPYVLFEDFMVSRFGELEGNNVLVIIGLNAPALPCLLIYFLYDGIKGLGKYLGTLIPRKKDLFWIPIVIVVPAVCAIIIRFILVLFNLGAPEITSTLGEMLVGVLKNFWQESGMIGVAIGFYGFVLPYFQRQYKNNIKAGFMTGLLLGLLFLPSAANIVFYLLYVMQHIIFSICISFILNETKGNVLFYMIAMCIAGAGGSIGLYEFNISVQVIEICLYIILAFILYYTFKKRNADKAPEEILQVFPEFIECRKNISNKDINSFSKEINYCE